MLIMELLLKRIAKKQSYTIGKLYVDGLYECDVIEDADRGLDKSHSLDYIIRNKKYGITAIPTGKYKVRMDIKSSKYSNYTKYPYAKPYNGKMPRLENVPGWEGILIHPGNTERDSLGCLIVGENKAVGKVLNSQIVWKRLMEKLIKANDDIYITIK